MVDLPLPDRRLQADAAGGDQQPRAEHLHEVSPREAGFVLRNFQEPMTTDEELKASARFEHMKRIPYFVFMRWEKTLG